MQFFNHWPNQKRQYKSNHKEFFDSIFTFGKLRSSSLTYFLVFVVLYLNVFENMDQMSEKHIFLLLLHLNEADDVIILVT